MVIPTERMTECLWHFTTRERNEEFKAVTRTYATEQMLFFVLIIINYPFSSSSLEFCWNKKGKFSPAIFPLGILNCFVSWGRHFHDWSHCCILCWCFSESRWDGSRASCEGGGCLSFSAFGGWDPCCTMSKNFLRKPEYSKYWQIFRVSFFDFDFEEGICYRRYRLSKSACSFLPSGGTDLTIFEIHARRSQKQRSHRQLWCHCGKMKQSCWICMLKEQVVWCTVCNCQQP